MAWLGSLTRSPGVARLWFGVRVGPLEAEEHAFDATSLALPRLLRRRVRPGAHLLDLGTGSAAIVGLWAWRRLGCRVTASDVDPAIAARARENVRRNGAPIEVLVGRFLEPLHQRADLGSVDAIVFNPPYVPRAVGERRGLPERLRTQWDGGQDGTETFQAFLRAFERDGAAATAFVGLNRGHVPRLLALQRIASVPGLELREAWKHPLLPVDGYVLVRKKSPIAKASRPVE
jgi:hypothetical protein